MKPLFLILIVSTLLSSSCTVDNLYRTINDRWELQLPKAVTIVDGENNSHQKLTSSTTDLDYIFQYAPFDQAKLDELTIWTYLAPRDITHVVKQLYAYFYPQDGTILTPAEKLQKVEEKLGFAIDEQLRYYKKTDPGNPTGGRIILLYDSDRIQIHAFHFVE